MSLPLALPVPGFRAQSILDQDRMATVWLVADERGRMAILTVGHRVLIGEPERLDYLAWAEKLSLAASSPNIADVLAHGITDDGRPYLAVATEASSLADRLAAESLPPEEARQLGIALCEALSASHAAGLPHGAVRPAAILMSHNRALLAGYGSAAPGLAVPVAVDAYTPPEQLVAVLRGDVPATNEGDIYDLAAILYVAVGGRLPWIGAPTDTALRLQRLPAAAGMSPTLLAALQAAMATDPAGRPTAPAFGQLLTAMAPESEERATEAVDPQALRSSGLRRVAAMTAEALATSTASAVGGAAGSAIAAKLIGSAQPGTAPATAPVPTTPAPAGPPAAASMGTAPTDITHPPGGGHAVGHSGKAGGAASHTTTGVTKSIVIKIVVAATVAAVAGGGVYAYSKSHASSTVNAKPTPQHISGPLRADPGREDFGTIWLRSRSARTVTVTNTGAGKLTLNPATVTGQGFSIKRDSCAGHNLAGGASCAVVVVLRPATRGAYSGEVSVRSGKYATEVTLTGKGEIVDLSGAYRLTRKSIDPPVNPTAPVLGTWDGAKAAGDELIRSGVHITAASGCTQPPCEYRFTVFKGGRSLPLTAGANGTIHIASQNASTWALQPKKINGGKLASFVLIVTVVGADNVKVTQTFLATRR
jgi:hypothetical protein